MFRLSFLVVLIAFSSVECKKEKNSGKETGFLDLTYTFNNDTILWPGRKAVFSTEIKGKTPNGAYFFSKAFCTSEHTSTHIDAPSHASEEGWSLDQIPFEYLIDVPGAVIDVYDKVHEYKDGKLIVNHEYTVTREDIIEWEKKNGRLPDRALIMVRTGWGARWGDKAAYYGTPQKEDDGPQEPGKINLNVQLSFPGFAESAAKFLVAERSVLGVGIDCLSIDPGSSKTFPAHVAFASRNVYMLENVANLHLLPPKGFRLWAVPFKIDGGTGAPTRVLAKLDD